MNKFEAIKISNNVFWVGAIDWNIRNMHGYATHRGTTYNAFLIMGEEPILIDTVKLDFYDEMMSRINSIINPNKIAYIISNHAEMDHSGSLVHAVNAINPKKIYASKNGKIALEKHFKNSGLNIDTVENGEVLDLAGNSFTFFETRMLHWPDSMVSYYHNDKILFTQDGFGMHLATTHLMASDNKKETIRYEAAKYFANILMPYSAIAKNVIKKLMDLDLEIDLIAPDHGPLWNTPELIKWIFSLYSEWLEQKPCKKAVVLFDSMWHSTEILAETIADTFMHKGIDVVVVSATKNDRSDLATEILECGILMVGTPTLNNNMFPTIADHLYYLKGLKPKNLIGQVFGSYGWSGEGVGQIEKIMKDMGVELIGEPLKCIYVPDDEIIGKTKKLAESIAEKLLNRS